MGTDDPDPLPKITDLGCEVGLGLMLALLRTLFLMPLPIFFLVFGVHSLFEVVLSLSHWVLHSIFGWGETITLAQVWNEFLEDALVEALGPIAYLATPGRFIALA